MAIYTVTDAGDGEDAADGVLTLREAVAAAANSAGADTIRFAKDVSFVTLAAPVEITDTDLTIVGDHNDDGIADVVISGGPGRALTIDAEASARIVGVHFGYSFDFAADGGNGATGTKGADRFAAHDLADVLSDQGISLGSPAQLAPHYGRDGTSGEAGGRGTEGAAGARGDDAAGAILNHGNLTLVRTTFGDNHATGGTGGSGGSGGWGGTGGGGGEGIWGAAAFLGGEARSLETGDLVSLHPDVQATSDKDGGDGGAGGNGGRAGDGGNGGAGGDAAGAILNEAGATLHLVDVGFGGIMASGFYGGGNEAQGGTGQHGGSGGLGGLAASGADGQDAGYGDAYESPVIIESSTGGPGFFFISSEAGALGGGINFRAVSVNHALEPGAGGLGGDGGIGGRGGDGGDGGPGGDAATIINRGEVTGKAGFSAENTATAGTSSTTVAHGGRGGSGGSGGTGGRSYNFISNDLRDGIVVEGGVPKPAYNGMVTTTGRFYSDDTFTNRDRSDNGFDGPDGATGADGAVGSAGKHRDAIFTDGGVTDVNKDGALVFIHGVHTTTTEGGKDIQFNVIRYGDADETLTVSWAVLRGSSVHHVNGADFKGGALPHGTVTLDARPSDAGFDWRGSFETVHVKVATDGAMEGKENFVIALHDVSGSAVIGTSRITGAINDNKAPVPTAGDDDLKGTSHADSIDGKGGNDIIHGAGGDDTLFGDAGRDQLIGGAGADILNGGGGGDALNGNGGDDVLRGAAGNDRLNGGGGHDTIDGGKGDDSLAGGAMTDTFAFSNGFGHDSISGFSANNHEDIDLSGVSGITGFHNLITHHLTTDDGSGFALITDGTSNTILLMDYTVDDFGAGQPISGADFIFA